jgi:hypothetical protein
MRLATHPYSGAPAANNPFAGAPGNAMMPGGARTFGSPMGHGGSPFGEPASFFGKYTPNKSISEAGPSEGGNTNIFQSNY